MVREFVSAALSFNPVVSLVGAALAAALWTRSRSWLGVSLSWFVLLVAWFAADGILLVAMLDRSSAEGGADHPLIIAGGVAALAIGYALPAWSGAFVGKRVTKGTGWMSAAVVALSTWGAVSAIAARFG